MASKTDRLGDKLAAVHLIADDLAQKNIDIKTAGKIKFPRQTSELVKKLTVFYVLFKYKTKVPKAYENVRDAYDLYIDRDVSSIKWNIEALLVGGASSSKTAELCGVKKPVVDIYKKAFFDVDKKENKIQLINKSSLKFRDYTDNGEDVNNWGHKIEAYKKGVEYYVRTRMKMEPTSEDKSFLKELRRDRVLIAGADASLLINNPDNYKKIHLLEYMSRVGADHKSIQAEDTHALRVQTASNGSGGGHGIDEFNVRIMKIIETHAMTPASFLVSVFDEEQPAEESLPI